MPKISKPKNVKVDESRDLLRMDNHRLGCNLESYANVLRYRGYEIEANQLDEIASRIK